jgi:hypothetical protein
VDHTRPQTRLLARCLACVCLLLCVLQILRVIRIVLGRLISVALQFLQFGGVLRPRRLAGCFCCAFCCAFCSAFVLGAEADVVSVADTPLDWASAGTTELSINVPDASKANSFLVCSNVIFFSV